jgi:hypothetical protein
MSLNIYGTISVESKALMTLGLTTCLAIIAIGKDHKHFAKKPNGQWYTQSKCGATYKIHDMMSDLFNMAAGLAQILFWLILGHSIDISTIINFANCCCWVQSCIEFGGVLIAMVIQKSWNSAVICLTNVFGWLVSIYILFARFDGEISLETFFAVLLITFVIVGTLVYGFYVDEKIKDLAGKSLDSSGEMASGMKGRAESIATNMPKQLQIVPSDKEIGV